MKKDKLRVIIIAAVIVVAVVAGIVGLKIEPAHPAAGDDPVVSEKVTNSPEISEKPAENTGKPEETPSETPLPEGSQNPGGEGAESASPAPEVTPNSGEGSVGDEGGNGEATAAPAPTATPTPVPSAEPEEEKLTCFIEIRCDTVMDTSVIENEAVIPYLPANGVVLAETEVEFEEGDSAFDVLNKVCRAKDIQMEFRQDGAYSGYYIEGINYLYEFDAGALSGWMYKVNEKFPNYGCANYKMQKGDKMVWVYTTDLGRDVGDNSEW